jgi:hypothetical protein
MDIIITHLQCPVHPHHPIDMPIRVFKPILEMKNDPSKMSYFSWLGMKDPDWGPTCVSSFPTL